MLTRCSCVNDYLTDIFTYITPHTDIIFARDPCLDGAKSRRLESRLIASLINYESYGWHLYPKSRRTQVRKLIISGRGLASH